MKDHLNLLNVDQLNDIDEQLENYGFEETGYGQHGFDIESETWNRVKRVMRGEECIACARVFFSIVSSKNNTMAAGDFYLTKLVDDKELTLTVHLESFDEVRRYTTAFLGDLANEILTEANQDSL